jgi:hypothetical protein
MLCVAVRRMQTMKNITLAIDEDVLDAARLYAAKNKTTVNALVRLHLEQIARNEDRLKQAMAELKAMSASSSARLGTDYRFDREATYER